MRKGRLFGIAFAASLVAALASGTASLAFADTTIKASELTSTELALTEDTTLVMDADVTLTKVTSPATWSEPEAGFKLTVEGPYDFKVAAEEGVAVTVTSFEATTNVSLTNKAGDGMRAYGPVDITGDLYISCEGQYPNGIYDYGMIKVDGDLTIPKSFWGLYADSYQRPAGIEVTGDVVCGECYSLVQGSNCPVTIGGSVKADKLGYVAVYGKGVEVGGDIEVTSSGCYGLYSSAGARVDGNFKATAKESGVYMSAYGDVGSADLYIGGTCDIECGTNGGIYNGSGSVEIEGATNITAGDPEQNNGWCCIYAQGKITLHDDANLLVNNPKSGECLYSGDAMTLYGDVIARGGSIGIMAGSSKDAPLIAYGDIDVTIYDAGFEGFALYGPNDFYGDVRSTAPSFGMWSQGPVRFHGGTIELTGTQSTGLCCHDIIEIDGADATLTGALYGIDAKDYFTGDGRQGAVIAKSGRLELTGGTYAAISESGYDVIEPMTIIDPENATIVKTTVKDSERYTIADADGNPVTHALIMTKAPEPVRLAGDYANETAAAIAKEAFPEGSEWVVIARDDDFADALGATGLAGALDAPIVLTNREELSEAAAAEVTRLGAKKAYIIGGTGAIKDQVDADLKALGVDVQPRIWGENSYDTSLECAKKIGEHGGITQGAIVAMSTNFQDALSISPFAYRQKCPLILQTWGDTSADRGFTDEAKAWLAGRNAIVVGGTGAVSDESLVEAGVAEVSERLWGETGYDTSDAIAEWCTEIGILSDSAAVFACGAQAPGGVDALAGSALAGRLGCPVLLVNGNEEIEAIDTTTIDGYFAEHALHCKDLYILGGTYVMPESIVDKILALYPKA